VLRLARRWRCSTASPPPFSKNNHATHPRRPGRRPGLAYGTRAHRQVPDHIDETVTVPFPRYCPGCGAEAVYEGTEHVCQQELPRLAVHNRCFALQRGRCPRCGAAVRGRHPDQASSAKGAAGCHLGAARRCPRGGAEQGVRAVGHQNRQALRAARHLCHPGGVVGLLHRAARAALPTYRGLVAGVRNSGVVSPDETGWRAGGHGCGPSWARGSPSTSSPPAGATPRRWSCSGETSPG